MAGKMTAALAAFLTKHLNVWTRQKVLWLKMDKWDQASNAAPFVRDQLKGRRCFVALDLSKTSDLTALVLVFPNEDGSYEVLPYFWMPDERAQERTDSGEFQYLVCAQKQLITLTPGDSTDYRFVRKQIVDIWGEYDVAGFAFDPWNARHLVTELIEEDGLDADRIKEFGQTLKNFNEPTKHCEDLVNKGQLHHGGNAVLRWMAGNATVKTDPSGNIRPVKPEHMDPKKIDGIVALIMALGTAIANPDDGSSVYEDRGITTL
jgi:phage terminase large subunit-like protein